ncbi:MAG TPA: malate dehydrogenase, partial [Accumulibacter sp.]|nr:malate dehydrogenase [Accumulibacter sp.]
LATKTGRPVASFKQLVVWGDHSPTMYADYRNCTSNGDNVKQLINDAVWNNDVFLPTVGKRGAAIIDARGLSSAASAANAAIDHMRDWVLGSDEWVTMGVPSDGSYGIPAGIVFGFPCECKGGSFKIIQGIEIDDYSRDKMNKTLKELTDEADAVKDML